MEFNLYKNIQTLCEDRKITIAEVERKANISNGSVRRWADSYPSIDKVARVAEVLNTTLEFIYYGKQYIPVVLIKSHLIHIKYI